MVDNEGYVIHEVAKGASLGSLERELAALENAFKETETTLGTEEELTTNYENARENFLLQQTRIKKLKTFQTVRTSISASSGLSLLPFHRSVLTVGSHSSTAPTTG